MWILGLKGLTLSMTDTARTSTYKGCALPGKDFSTIILGLDYWPYSNPFAPESPINRHP